MLLGTYGYLRGLDDLLFMGPVVRTSEKTSYYDLTLTDETKVLDAVYGVVGTRTGTVVTRESGYPTIP